MCKLYETIDELIKNEEKPADYCFDEAWLEWVYSTKLKAEDATQKACLAIELMKPSYYFTDAGPVQQDMYKTLMESSEIKYEYSPDRMTNFYYVLKIALFFLDLALYSKNVPSRNFGTAGPRKYQKKRCYSGAYDAFKKEVGKLEKNIVEPVLGDFKSAMMKFAERSSMLGNYGWVSKSLFGYKSINVAKGIGKLFVKGSGESGPLRVNDQFALFLSWLETQLSNRDKEENNRDKEEKEVVSQWMKDMLIKCDKKLCNKFTQDSNDPEFYYKAATQCYKEAFSKASQGDQTEAIKQFTKYLENVNTAIERRSVLIVGTIRGMKKTN